MNLFKTLIIGLCILPSIAIAQLESTDFNKRVNPNEDFYEHVNGGWMEKTEIPASEGGWASFYEIIERNRSTIKGILEEVSSKNNPKGTEEQMVGDLYKSAMNLDHINKMGMDPIRKDFQDLDSMQTIDDVLTTITNFQHWGLSTPFYFYVQPDSKNSKMYAAGIWQGGISLPSRTYYLNKTERFSTIRSSYLEHITNMFVLAGSSKEVAEQNANTILEIETRMAQAHRSPVQNRNPEKSYNKLSKDDLKRMTFNLNWDKFFEMVGAEQTEYVIVNQPEYLAMFDRMLGDVAVQDWAVYFKWKMLSNRSNYLSEDFVNEDFNFFSKTLRGIQENKPRWKNMQSLVDNQLGQPLGKLFVAKTFPPEAKARMIEMIENLRSAFAVRIDKLEWMSEPTKVKAQEKLAAITYKIGYPDVWRDYSGLEIVDNDLIANLKNISAFNKKFSLARIGKSVDSNDWSMSPPTVNAYYSPIRNEIVFPAGILQPPFFDFDADDAINYGGIGAVIGHEITHGFDDQGSQYDAEGNLKMWWTPEDREKFNALTSKIVEQYNNYTVLDSIHVNGELTLGENIADLGGVAMAYDALLLHYKKTGIPKMKDGFSPKQRFFVGFARIWRSKYREQVLIERIKTDSHSPGIHRCNGTLSNTPDFHNNFNVKEGDKMKKEEIIKIW